jgi:ribosomal protein S18 acetylase RimI-like enzyme
MEKVSSYGRTIDGNVFDLYQLETLDEVTNGFLALKESNYDAAVFEIDRFKAFMEKIYKNAFVYIYVQAESMKPIGLLALYANDKETHTGFITMIVVDKKWQKHDFGKALIEVAKNKCQKECMNKIRLCVHKMNTNARGFYKKMGFIEDGEANEHQYWASMEL